MSLTFGRLAAVSGAPTSVRYFASCVVVMAFASFLSIATRNAREFKFKKSTAGGPTLPPKNRKGL